MAGDSWQANIDDETTRPGVWLDHLMHRKLFRWAGIKSGEFVLDVGVGRAYMSLLCMEIGAVYCGLDNSVRVLDELPAGDIRHLATVPPLPELPIRPDVIFLSFVLEHMDTATKAFELIVDCHRVLSPGGRLIVCVPATDAWSVVQFNATMWQHQTRTTLCNVRQMFYDASFRQIRYTYTSGPIFSYWPAVFVSWLARWLPFCRLKMLFPESRAIHKLKKLQDSFLRMVLFEARK